MTTTIYILALSLPLVVLALRRPLETAYLWAVRYRSVYEPEDVMIAIGLLYRETERVLRWKLWIGIGVGLSLWLW